MTDTAGHDVLCGPAIRLNKDSLLALQACATASLATKFTVYSTPGSADSTIVFQFPNLRTPAYGESGNCFRVMFRWSLTDTDTLDWHYRIDDRDGCPVQVIDYLSYNGRQSAKVHGNNYDYYQLVK